MRPRRDPVPRARARDAWTWLGGTALLGILGAGVVAAAVVLWENIDIRRLVPQLAAAAPGLPVPDPPPQPATAETSFAAVLFDSPRNRDYYPDSLYYGRALADWEALLRDAGGAVRRVGTAADLRTLAATDLLVLPEAPCVSDGEWAAVRGHLARGGSLVTNWAFGARDVACGWKGWQVISEITGAEDVREIPERQGLFLTVPAEIALSPGLDPGTRIELRPEPSLALRLSGPRVYWSDWALNPRPDESGGGADAAATATVTVQGGRVAWFGLRLEQAVSPFDAARLRRLVRNGVLFAAGVPFAAPAPWPDGHRAALLFALDVEDEPRNAIATADLLAERGLPGTFYVVSQLVQADSGLARGLADVGEVGSQTTDHTPVVGLTPQDQGVRLRRSWADIAAWTGVGPAGLHPPEERFDASTLDAWAQAGGTYLLAANDARSASPEIHRTERSMLVVLPRLVKDDYNIIVQDRVIRATNLGEAWIRGIRKQHAIGGLAVVAGHTQIMRPGPRIEALAGVMSAAREQGGWWTTTGAEVADWWRRRAEVRLRFAPPDDAARGGLRLPGVPDLLVEAPEGVDLTGLWVQVVLPGVTDAVVPVVDGAPVDFTSTEFGIRLPVGPLRGGATVRVSFVRLEDEARAGALSGS